MEESTGAVGTEQWLELSKSWQIFAYIPGGHIWELTKALPPKENIQPTSKKTPSRRRKEGRL